MNNLNTFSSFFQIKKRKLLANDDQKAYHHYIHQRFKDKRFVLLLHNIKRFVSLFVCFFDIKKKGEDAAPTAATS